MLAACAVYFSACGDSGGPTGPGDNGDPPTDALADPPPDGTAAADCVPECSERYHGYLMLLNIDGDDSKLSCELHHGYYSWVGAATDGGYMGADAQSFFSAVVSGAAGVYIVTLTADAGISNGLPSTLISTPAT